MSCPCLLDYNSIQVSNHLCAFVSSKSQPLISELEHNLVSGCQNSAAFTTLQGFSFSIWSFVMEKEWQYNFCSALSKSDIFISACLYQLCFIVPLYFCFTDKLLLIWADHAPAFTCPNFQWWIVTKYIYSNTLLKYSVECWQHCRGKYCTFICQLLVIVHIVICKIQSSLLNITCIVIG